MPHVVQDLAFVGCNPGGGEETSILGLCYKGADDRYARGVGGNGVVEWGVVIGVTKEVVTAGHTAGAGSGKVGCVGERAKNHFGGAENFPSVRVGGSVAEEAVKAFHGVCSR